MKQENKNEIIIDKVLVIMLGFMLLLFLMSCKTKQDKFDMEECRITDSIKSATIDSLMNNEMKTFETQAEMYREIQLLKRAFDSIEDSNNNLRNYIKHQDKMINKK